MALATPTQFELIFQSQLAPDGDSTGGSVAQVLVDLFMANGVGANQADGLFHDSRDLVASANEDIDLQLIQDENKNALAALQVVLLIIQAPSTNQGTIRMRDSAATPWLSFLSSSGATDDAQADIIPGAFVVVGCPVAAAYAVAGGNKIINFINLDGANTNTYVLTILTRSA